MANARAVIVEKKGTKWDQRIRSCPDVMLFLKKMAKALDVDIPQEERCCSLLVLLEAAPLLCAKHGDSFVESSGLLISRATMLVLLGELSSGALVEEIKAERFQKMIMLASELAKKHLFSVGPVGVLAPDFFCSLDAERVARIQVLLGGLADLAVDQVMRALVTEWSILELCLDYIICNRSIPDEKFGPLLHALASSLPYATLPKGASEHLEQVLIRWKFVRGCRSPGETVEAVVDELRKYEMSKLADAIATVLEMKDGPCSMFEVLEPAIKRDALELTPEVLSEIMTSLLRKAPGSNGDKERLVKLLVKVELLPGNAKRRSVESKASFLVSEIEIKFVPSVVESFIWETGSLGLDKVVRFTLNVIEQVIMQKSAKTIVDEILVHQPENEAIFDVLLSLAKVLPKQQEDIPLRILLAAFCVTQDGEKRKALKETVMETFHKSPLPSITSAPRKSPSQLSKEMKDDLELLLGSFINPRLRLLNGADELEQTLDEFINSGKSTVVAGLFPWYYHSHSRHENGSDDEDDLIRLLSFSPRSDLQNMSCCLEGIPDEMIEISD